MRVNKLESVTLFQRRFADEGTQRSGIIKTSAVEKVLDKIDLALQILCVALLVVVTASVVWQVIARYVTRASSSWTVELASYAFVWLAMLAIALGVRRGRHMVLNVWEYVPYRKWLTVLIETVAAIIIVGVLAALVWYGFQALAPSWRRNSPGLGISYGWVSLAVPVGSAFSLLFAIEAWWRLIHAPKDVDPLPTKVIYQPDDVVVIKGEL